MEIVMARTMLSPDARRALLLFEMTPRTRAVMFTCSGTRARPHSDSEECLVLASLSDDDDDRRGLVFTMIPRKFRRSRAGPTGRMPFKTVTMDTPSGEELIVRDVMNVTCPNPTCLRHEQLRAERVGPIVEASMYGCVVPFNVSNVR